MLEARILESLWQPVALGAAKRTSRTHATVPQQCVGVIFNDTPVCILGGWHALSRSTATEDEASTEEERSTENEDFVVAGGDG